MPSKKKFETANERIHGHCADVLMDDYGIHKTMRAAVCDEVAKVWRQITMIHCLIIASVRGYQPHGATRGLEFFLQEHATCEPKNHKKVQETRPEGRFDSQGYYREH